MVIGCTECAGAFCCFRFSTDSILFVFSAICVFPHTCNILPKQVLMGNTGEFYITI